MQIKSELYEKIKYQFVCSKIFSHTSLTNQQCDTLQIYEPSKMFEADGFFSTRGKNVSFFATIPKSHTFDNDISFIANHSSLYTYLGGRFDTQFRVCEFRGRPFDILDRAEDLFVRHLVIWDSQT